MSQELGKVERPEAAPFKPERKVYLVPLLFTSPDAPAEFAGLLERYWEAAEEQVSRLEVRIGAVNHVYMEMADRAGEEGLQLAEAISAGAGKFARNRCSTGAAFEALEDAETLAEAMDWERCLMVGLASRKAVEYVNQAYRDASSRRYQMMAKRLDETLKEGEAALAFLTEHHWLQFPDSVRVFYVSPPALDEIHRWLRAYRERPPQAEAPEEGQPGPSAGDEPAGDSQAQG